MTFGAGLAFVDAGDGACVALLHGQPGESGDWSRVVDALDGRVRSIVPDRPGYGATGGPATGVKGNAAAVVTLLDHLGIDRVVVAGHSWGGAVALELALAHPARIAGLVLAASVGSAESVDEVDQVLSLPVIGPLLSLAALGIIRAPLARQAVSRVARLARLDVPGSNEFFPEHRTPWSRAWRSFVIEQHALVEELPAITSALGSISAPAVVLLGELDRVVSPAAQANLAASLGSARLERIPAAGHLLPLQEPDVVADAILSLTGAG